MKRGHVPIRSCKGCGKKAPKADLWRFYFENDVLVQRDCKSGYGIYCCPTETCRQRMQSKVKKRKQLKPTRDEDRSN